MRGKTPWKLAVGATALVLVAAGCSGDEGGETESEATGGELRVYSGEPEHLIPSNTNESEGSAVVRAVYDMLVDYDPEDGKPVMKIAEEITSDDQKVWTIKLKDTWKFHNGEPVNADAFIRAWNFAAYAPNAQGNSYFFDRIVGYADLQSEDPDGDGPQPAPDPAAKEMSGLKKVDETTIEVTLTEAFSGFPTMLGYNAFAPLAEACVADIKACEEQPIGNGPFKFDGTWEHDVQIKTVRNDDYAGEKAKVDRLTFRIYADLETGYADFQAGNLDILDTVPPEQYAQAKQQYGDQIIEQASSSFTYVGLPLSRPEFKDKRVRQAISLAIDRQQIIDAVFSGRFTPAKSVVSPLVPGSRENACPYCDPDPARAKQLLADAGGWKGGTLQLWFNAGAGHEQWMQAVGNQLKTNLGINYALKGDLQFAEYLGVADEKKFTGPFRLGWIMDYPLPENYLKPLYGTQGSSNNTGYTNPQFDQLITQGDSAGSIDEAITFYNQAEDLILEDLPVIPMWFGKTSVLKGENVSDITYNRVNELEFESASLKSS
jgi:peptide/nickel transport system substrate-binding protein